MRSTAAKMSHLDRRSTHDRTGLLVGQIVQINDRGEAVVDYPGNPGGPLKARSVIQTPGDYGRVNRQAVPVLLAFENNDPLFPIIIGMLRETLYDVRHGEALPWIEGRPQDALLDGRRVTIDAKDEIVLRCGKGSVIITKDGKIVLKGTKIVSRSSGQNKIKGASVMIN